MDKVLKIINVNEPQSDFSFWMGKSMIDRLNAIEELRLQYLSLNKNVQPRLQRVCRIINQKSS